MHVCKYVYMYTYIYIYTYGTVRPPWCLGVSVFYTPCSGRVDSFWPNMSTKEGGCVIILHTGICLAKHGQQGTGVCHNSAYWYLDSLIAVIKESRSRIQAPRVLEDFQCEYHVLLLPGVLFFRSFKQYGVQDSRSNIFWNS